MKKFLSVLFLAFSLAAVGVMTSCGTGSALQKSVTTESQFVKAMHLVVQSEATAYKAGAYSQVKHQQYDAALKKVVDSEKAINDALITWSKASGQPRPAVLNDAVAGLQSVMNDVSPLLPTNVQGTVSALVGSVSAALAVLGA